MTRSSATSTRGCWPCSTAARTPRASSPTTAGSTRRRATASSGTSSPPRPSSTSAARSASATPATRPSAAAAAEDAQPFQLNSPFGIIMAHNGNVANYKELKEELFEKHHRLLNSDCDVEIILNIFAESLAHERARTLEPEHVYRAVESVYRKVRGQLLRRRLHRRAGHGRLPRPLRHQASGLRRAEGRPPPLLRLRLRDASRSTSWASASCGTSRPARSSSSTRAGASTRSGSSAAPIRPCLFEWVYFARPDSFIDKANVYKCPGQPGPLPGRRDPQAEARDRRRRPRARLGPGRGHRDRPQAQPEVQRGPGQEPLHRPDLHHAGRREAQGLGPPEAQPHRLRVQGQERPPRRRQHRPGQHVPGHRPDGPGLRRQEGLFRLLLAAAPPPLRLRHRHADQDGVRGPGRRRERGRPQDRRRQGHLPEPGRPEEGRPAGEPAASSTSAPPASTASTRRATSRPTSSRTSRRSASSPGTPSSSSPSRLRARSRAARPASPPSARCFRSPRTAGTRFAAGRGNNRP